MLCKNSPRNIRGILISNVSFNKSLEEEISNDKKDVKEILPNILISVNHLEKAGANFIVIPCNTLHALVPKIKEQTSIPILDLIEEVSKIVDKKYETIGIIGTTKTKKERLYNKTLKKSKVIYPLDLEQEKISKIIIRIIRKETSEQDKIFLEKIIDSLIKQGAKKVLLACTDLANIIKKNPNTLDTTEILINSIKEKMK